MLKLKMIVTAALTMTIFNAGIIGFSKAGGNGSAQISFLHLIPVISHEHHRGPTGS
jgi:hypothetical protein